MQCVIDGQARNDAKSKCNASLMVKPAMTEVQMQCVIDGQARNDVKFMRHCWSSLQ
jgi:hypothetical protein